MFGFSNHPRRPIKRCLAFLVVFVDLSPNTLCMIQYIMFIHDKSDFPPPSKDRMAVRNKLQDVHHDEKKLGFVLRPNEKIKGSCWT